MPRQNMKKARRFYSSGSLSMVLVDYEDFYNIPKGLPTLVASGHHQLVCKLIVVIFQSQIYEYFLFGKLFLAKK